MSTILDFAACPRRAYVESSPPPAGPFPPLFRSSGLEAVLLMLRIRRLLAILRNGLCFVLFSLLSSTFAVCDSGYYRHTFFDNGIPTAAYYYSSGNEIGRASCRERV